MTLSTNLSKDEQSFILELISTSLDSIKVYLSKNGIVYTQLEEKVGKKGFRNFEKILKGLYDKGYLKIVDEQYTLFCPHCDFPYIYTKYTCPTCTSTHVTQYYLIQHPFCGYTGKKLAIEDTEVFPCPKCKTTLFTDADKVTDAEEKNYYEIIGFSFECNNGHHFERPLITHLCPNCGAKFNYKESKYRPIYSYELTEKAYQLVDSDEEIEIIAGKAMMVLQSLGVEASFKAEFMGLSSSKHKIDLLGKKDNHTLLIDVSTEGAEDELIILLGVKMDVKNSYAILITRKCDEEVLALGQVYGIKVFDINEENWLTKFTEHVKEILKE